MSFSAGQVYDCIEDGQDQTKANLRCPVASRPTAARSRCDASPRTSPSCHPIEARSGFSARLKLLVLNLYSAVGCRTSAGGGRTMARSHRSHSYVGVIVPQKCGANRLSRIGTSQRGQMGRECFLVACMVGKLRAGCGQRVRLRRLWNC
jgi:hypothetical protein